MVRVTKSLVEHLDDSLKCAPVLLARELRDRLECCCAILHEAIQHTIELNMFVKKTNVKKTNTYRSTDERNTGKGDRFAKLVGALVGNPITARVKKLDRGFFERGMREIIGFTL